MDRACIKKLGTDPLNGNDAYAILGIAFDWIKQYYGPLPSRHELERRLKEAGYFYEKETPALRDKVKEVLRGFGFDDFMTGQIFEALNRNDLINKEPLGDAISKVLQTLEDQGWDLNEVHAAVEAMQNNDIVFRER